MVLAIHGFAISSFDYSNQISKNLFLYVSCLGLAFCCFANWYLFTFNDLEPSPLRVTKKRNSVRNCMCKSWFLKDELNLMKKILIITFYISYQLRRYDYIINLYFFSIYVNKSIYMSGNKILTICKRISLISTNFFFRC